jgi:caffeoyl-CoA O-methyltransferase
MPVVEPDIEGYVAAHTSPEPPWLQALADETRRSTSAPQMMVGPVEGRFLQTLVHLSGARRVLEIGMFTGYSALWMAAALPPDGLVVTCEIDAQVEAVARRHIAASPYADRIEIRMGPALETLSRLEGPFDLVFIDADKASYRDYYEAALPMLSERGAIVVDNVLWDGQVLDDSDRSADRLAIVDFNRHVRHDPRVSCVMLTVRDGITLIRRG